MSIINTALPNNLIASEGANGQGSQDEQLNNFLALLNIAGSTIQTTPADEVGPRALPQPKEQTPLPTGAKPREVQSTAAQRQEVIAPNDRQERAPREAQNGDPRPRTSESPAPAREATPLKAKPKAEKTTESSTQNTADELRELEAKQAQIQKKLQEQLETLDIILAAMIQAFSLRQFTKQQAVQTTQISFELQSKSTTQLTQYGATQFTNTEFTAQYKQLSAFSATGTSTLSESGIVLPDSFFGENTSQDLAVLKQLQASLQELRLSLSAATQGLQNVASTSPSQRFSATLTQTTTIITQSTTATNPSNDSLAARFQELLARLGATPADNVQITARQETDLETDTTNATASREQKPLTFANLFAAIKDGLQQVRVSLGGLQEEHEIAGTKLQEIVIQTSEIVEGADSGDFFSRQEGQANYVKTELPTATLFNPNAKSEDLLSNLLFGNSNTNTTFAAAQSVSATSGERGSNQNNGGSSNNGQQSNQQNIQNIGNTSQNTTDATRGTASKFANALARSTPALVNDQIQFQVKNAVRNGTSNIHIQLDPEELGKLDIRLSVEANGKTGVTILVDSRQTLDLLQRDAAGLTRALNEAGLSTDSGSLNFNLRGGDQQQQSFAQNSKTAQYSKNQPIEETDIPALLSQSETHQSSTDNGLDITI